MPLRRGSSPADISANVAELVKAGHPQKQAEAAAYRVAGRDGDKGHAAGTLYVAPDGDVLMLRRSSTEENYAGHWALPGGGSEDGETPEETARREAAEEMGTAPDGKMKLLGRKTTPTGMTFHTFAQPVAEKFQPKINGEHSGFAWSPLNALPEPMHPAVKATIHAALHGSSAAQDCALDMSPEDWDGLTQGFLKWVDEEEAEPEHAQDRSHMAQDSLAFDRGTDENRTKTEDGRLLVKVSNISKANVCPYVGEEIPNWEGLGLDPKKIYYLYRDPAELKKGAPTFDKIPLMLIHKASTAGDHPREVTIGTTGEGTKFNAPYLQASLAIWDQEGVRAVESRRKCELSCGYRYDADMRPGRTPDGMPFDGRMVNLRGNHLTIVEDGRAGDDVVVGDSMENVNMATKIRLSQAGAAAYGALIVGLRPKLATDAKLGLAQAFVGVTAKNYKDRVPGIKLALDGALKGKLANDAEAGEIIKAAGKMLDLFQPEAEGMDDDPDISGMDGKWGEDDEAALKELMDRKKAAGQATDADETEEERKKREEKEKADKTAADAEAANGGKEAPVTKAAMDAAMKKMAADNAAAVRNAEAATVQRMNDIADAKALVEPLVGKIVVAMDSAEAVLSSALKSLGIAADGINVAGMRALVEREISHKVTSGRNTAVRIAQDSARHTGGASLAESVKSIGINIKTVRSI